MHAPSQLMFAYRLPPLALLPSSGCSTAPPKTRSPSLHNQAVEVGPCTEKVGPCLVFFSGCKLAPAELNRWLYSGASCSAAVVRCYWLGSEPREASSHKDLVAQLRAAGPPPDGGALRLQCAPRTLEAWLADQLGPAFNLQPVSPKWVLNVVSMAAEGGEEGEEEGGEAAQQAVASPDDGRQQQGAAAAPVAGEQDGQQPAQQEQQVEHRRRRRVLYSLQPATTLYNYSPVKDKRIPDQLSKAAGKRRGGASRGTWPAWLGGQRRITWPQCMAAQLPSSPVRRRVRRLSGPAPLSAHLILALAPWLQASWQRRCRPAGSG